MKSICVFCGSSPGNDPIYMKNAAALGAMLAKNNIRLVYGGAKVGTMGATAKAAMENNGRVTGVITEHLKEMEVSNTDLTDLRIVDSMHERKSMMADLSDGFIALPGGFGTIEELFEMITWSQLGLAAKPCGILNSSGFYDQLMAFVDHMIDQGFVNRAYKKILVVDDDPARLIDKLSAYRHQYLNKGDLALKQAEQQAQAV